MATRNNGKQQAAVTAVTTTGEAVYLSCRLYRGRHHQLSTPATWKNKQACTLVLSLQVKPDALICKPCKDDATRVLANPTHIPRWEKAREVQKEKCCVLLCTDNVFVRGRLADSEKTQAAIELALLQS